MMSPDFSDPTQEMQLEMRSERQVYNSAWFQQSTIPLALPTWKTAFLGVTITTF